VETREGDEKVRTAFCDFTLPDVTHAFGADGGFQVYFSVFRNNPFDPCACASLRIFLQGR
jgi:hypothetical protein